MRAMVILAVAGLIAAPALQAQDFEWSGRLEAGQTIEIKGVNGDVHAMRASGNEIEVKAMKHEGRRGEADEVTFEVVEHDGGITICAMYPDDPDERPNRCAPGHGGHMNTNDNDTEVDFEVRVPARVNFVGKTVNGDVETDRLGGNAYAYTVNGGITVTADGIVEASTVNGSIHASMGRADWGGDLEFHTVNGSITVEMPAGVGAEVRASTVNGGLESDFPLTIQGRWGPRRLSGTIGDGGHRLDLETVNGSIRLKRVG